MMDKLDKGLWPVMLTPFMEDGSVDIRALQGLTHFYLRAGASGLFANCLSAEMYELTEDERLLITKTVVDAVEGKVKVVATGTFSRNPEKNVSFFKKLIDLGIGTVVVNTNQLVDEGEDENVLKKRLEELMDHSGEIPLGLYECPDPYKILLSPEIIGWAASTGRFLYHKDTSCDLDAIKSKISAVNGTNLGFVNAHMPTGLDSLKLGAAGLSPIGANLYPEIYSFLTDNFSDPEQQDNIARVNKVLTEIDPELHVNYPANAKYILQKRGLDISIKTRKSVMPMHKNDYEYMDKLSKKFNKLSVELDIDLAI